MSRTVVVAGATGVLGNLIAKTFAEQGEDIALLDHDQAKLDALVRDLDLPAGRLYAQTIDLLDGPATRASAEAVAAKFGRIHGLIHLVGGWTGGSTISETKAEDFEFMLDQHAWTTFHLFKAFAPHLAASGWGRVITLSIPLSVHPAPKMGAYAAGKAAQEALVQTLAEEFKEKGVTANIIHVKAIDVKGEGKGTTPAEIVAAITWLFSDPASKVSGARIPLY